MDPAQINNWISRMEEMLCQLVANSVMVTDESQKSWQVSKVTW